MENARKNERPSQGALAYPDFAAWFAVFKQACGRHRPMLKADPDGRSMVDAFEQEPLQRAYRDGIDPEDLARAFAQRDRRAV